MQYVKINVMAELGKLSQGKATTAPAWLIADQAIRKIRAGQKDSEREDLERLYRLDDTRAS